MKIPGYPDSRPIEIGDKSILDDHFRNIQPCISEFTFANLYLFRHAHQYRLTYLDKTLAILANGYGGEPYFLLPAAGAFEKAMHRLLSDGLTLYGADSSFVSRYLQGQDLEITVDRDNCDYLYSRSDLADLPGNRYHKKKNRINYFTRRNESMTAKYGPEHLKGCLEIVEDWKRVHTELEGGYSGDLESDANAEALLLAEQLGLEGVVATVNGAVKAFALGERLNRETSVCHFEKADPFLDGLYQLIDREFNRVLFTDCRFVNREQDLGIMNLRSSKLSYHPLELIEKFRVRKIM